MNCWTMEDRCKVEIGALAPRKCADESGRVRHPACCCIRQKTSPHPFKVVFFPISKLWVPRPCVFCKGGCDAANTIGCYAQRPASHLGGAPPPLHHQLVLPAPAFAGITTGARSLPLRTRRGTPALSLRGGGLCCDARARPPSDYRTGGGESFDSDASIETTHGLGLVAKEKAP